MDRRRTEARAIELFHLAFLQVLQARLDQACYVVKGGANLRYFFESVRYSEDIDLDAVEIESWRLTEKIDGVLGSPAMSTLLRVADLRVEEVSRPKQTEGTQRWKLSITVGSHRAALRTKIEFSHRGNDRRRVLEAVPDRLVAPYALRAPTMLHYTAEAAIEQKIAALAYRSGTQARDVFDLELLFRGHRDAIRSGTIESGSVDTARERTFELSFEAFQTQVIPFLDPEIVELYDDRDGWKRTQAFVGGRLMELR